MCLIHAIGGAFSHRPEELDAKLSSKSSDLIKRAFDDVDPAKACRSPRTHCGARSRRQTFVNPKMRTWKHPFHRLKFKVYMSSAGVPDEDNADAQLVERLASLVRHIHGHGKHRLLAFDKNYQSDGSVNLEKTEFYVPNEYVFELAEQHPELFVPNISVNPYRPDAISELEKWARARRARREVAAECDGDRSIGSEVRSVLPEDEGA